MTAEEEQRVTRDEWDEQRSAEYPTAYDNARYFICWGFQLVQMVTGILAVILVLAAGYFTLTGGPAVRALLHAGAYFVLSYVFDRGIDWLADDWWFPDGGVGK